MSSVFPVAPLPIPGYPHLTGGFIDPADPSVYPSFGVTVDLVVFTVRAKALNLLLVTRNIDPYRNRWALPGGFVQLAEPLLEAARRELREETALDLDQIHLEQLGSYGDPTRDPRMRVVSVAYLVLAADLPTPHADTDAAEADWVPVADALAERALAFDHEQILRDGLERARAKLEYSTLAATFCRQPFTVAELREVYDTVWGTTLDPRNFHRKVTSIPDFLIPTGQTTTRNGGRPAMLYHTGPATRLNPPLVRSE